jgi:hypothetical protein
LNRTRHERHRRKHAGALGASAALELGHQTLGGSFQGRDVQGQAKLPLQYVPVSAEGAQFDAAVADKLHGRLWAWAGD